MSPYKNKINRSQTEQQMQHYERTVSEGRHEVHDRYSSLRWNSFDTHSSPEQTIKWRRLYVHDISHILRTDQVSNFCNI